MKFLLISLLIISFPSYSWNGLGKNLATLDTAVSHLWSGGLWKHQGKEGFYRFIVAGGGHEHYRTKLYIQWVVNGTHSELPKIINTTQIKQLNEIPVYSFILPTCTDGWECNSIELSASHTYMKTEHKFKIKFTGIGEYDFDQTAL